MRSGSLLRTTAVISAAALALHELRYALIPDSAHAGGHAYLAVAMPLAATALGLALAGLLRRVAAPGHTAGGRSASRLAIWLLASLGLLSIFASQETLEALASLGRLPAPGAILGHGGLIAVPLAALLGAGVALLLHESEAILAGRAPGRGLSAVLIVPARLMPAWAELGHAIWRPALGWRPGGRAPPPSLA